MLVAHHVATRAPQSVHLSLSTQASSPTQYFWYRETLDISGNIEDPDNFNWPICLCLLAAWTLVYLCIIKGITENPKIIYITAIYPYVVLVIFFFRGITLEGMTDGIVHLFKPKVRRTNSVLSAPIQHLSLLHAVVSPGRPGGLARGRHADLLFAGSRLWRLNRLFVVQSCQ